MACVYPCLSLCFCVYVMVCAVAGENQNGNNGTERQGEEVENTGDARVSQRKYTSTTQNTNSDMMTSTPTKTIASFLVSTSLPVTDSSQTRSLIADHGSKSPSFNNVKTSRLDGPIGEDIDDTSQSTLVDDTSQSTLTAQFYEITEQQSNLEETGGIRQRENHEGTFRGVRQRDNLEETGDIRQRDNLDEIGGIRQRDNLEETEDIRQRDNLDEIGGIKQRDNLEEAEKSNHGVTDYRNFLKQLAQRHPEETGQSDHLDDTEQRSNLTEDEIFSNKIMKEINGSLDAENQTQTGEIMFNVSTAGSVVTTLPATKGYTRKHVKPTPTKPLISRHDLLTEKMENRANQCSMPLMLMWLLCLCRWIY